MPAASIYRLRIGLLEQPGMEDNVINVFSGTLRAIHEVITGNQDTPYIGAVSDLRNGPIVLEVPEKTEKAILYGQIVDAWQATVADLGPAGVDRGQGGKYLLLPPGYQGPVPDGYFVVRSSGYQILLVFRSVALAGASEADAYNYAKTLKLYPMSEAAARSRPASSTAARILCIRCPSTTCARSRTSTTSSLSNRFSRATR